MADSDALRAFYDDLPRATRSGFFAQHDWSPAGTSAALAALRRVDRARYVPPGARPDAHACHALGANAAGGVTMSKPVVHLFFVHECWRALADAAAVAQHAARPAAAPPPPARILDVGSGSGYLTAALASLLADARGGGAVLGVDVTRPLVALGAANFASDAPLSAALAAAGVSVAFALENARAPPSRADARAFAFIAVSAASDGGVPAALLERLAPGGTLVAPVADRGGHAQSFVAARRRADGALDAPRRLCEARFVPLVRPDDGDDAPG